MKTLQKMNNADYRLKTSTSNGSSAQNSPQRNQSTLKFAANRPEPARTATLTAVPARERGHLALIAACANSSHKAPNNLRMSERPVVNDHSMDEVDGGEAEDHSVTPTCA